MAKCFYQQGNYWGRITHQKLGQAKTGTPQLVLSFLVIGRINPMDLAGDLLPVEAQYERTVYRAITDKTIQYVEQDLDRLGFTGSSFGDFDEGSSTFCKLIGNELVFGCEHQKDQKGDFQERWSIARDNSAGPPAKPLEPKDVRALDAMFGRALKKRPTTTQQPPANTATDAGLNKPLHRMTQQEVADESTGLTDIPFGWLLPLAMAVGSAMVLA